LRKSDRSCFVGEPHTAKAELDAWQVFYRPGHLAAPSRAFWLLPKLIRRRGCSRYCAGIAESGEWAETHRIEAAKVVSPYFRQDEKLVRYVLTQPPDRVSYRMLTPTDDDLQKIHDMALKAGVLTKAIKMSDLIDREFIPKDIKAANIDVGQ
jgi:NitT/TauT family transport system substrate-binding protein